MTTQLSLRRLRFDPGAPDRTPCLQCERSVALVDGSFHMVFSVAERAMGVLCRVCAGPEACRKIDAMQRQARSGRLPRVSEVRDGNA